jgi:hypothetical protein
MHISATPIDRNSFFNPPLISLDNTFKNTVYAEESHSFKRLDFPLEATPGKTVGAPCLNSS